MTAVGARHKRKATVKIQKRKMKYIFFIFKKITFKFTAKIQNPNPKIRIRLNFKNPKIHGKSVFF